MRQRWSPTRSHPYTHGREGRVALDKRASATGPGPAAAIAVAASARACAIWVASWSACADARGSRSASPLSSVGQAHGGTGEGPRGEPVGSGCGKQDHATEATMSVPSNAGGLAGGRRSFRWVESVDCGLAWERGGSGGGDAGGGQRGAAVVCGACGTGAGGAGRGGG